MAQLDTMITDVRSRLKEPTAQPKKFFDDIELTTWINFGYKDFIARTEWVQRVKAYALVVNQSEYDLPTDYIKTEMMEFQDKFRIWLYDLDEFRSEISVANLNISTRPHIYLLYPWDRRFRIWPAPSVASPSTTINIGGGIDAVTTSITVASTTGFPSAGRAIIESEQVRYFNTSATQLLQCVRGADNTTAASHADTTAVDDGELTVSYRYDPPDLTGTDIPRIQAVWHEALILYAVHVGQTKRSELEKSTITFQQYLRKVEAANAERIKRQLDRNYVIKDEDQHPHIYFGSF